MNFLTATTAAAETVFDIVTPGNILLDENGQFVDPSQAIGNVASWWEKLDLVNKIIDKIPSIIIAVIMVFVGILLSRFVSKLLVKALKSRNVDPSVYNFIRRFISVAIKAAFILSALSMFFNIGSLVTALGAAGLLPASVFRTVLRSLQAVFRYFSTIRSKTAILLRSTEFRVMFPISAS